MEATRFCMECGKPLRPGAKYCAHCGTHVAELHPTPLADVQRPAPTPPIQGPVPQPVYQQASPFAQSYAPLAGVAKPKKKRSFKGLVIFGVIALLIGGAVFISSSVLPGLTGSNGKIVLGTEQAVAEVDVPATGGDIAVTDAASQIPGLTVSVPSGAYDAPTNFKISTTGIEKHTFGKAFTPITPLITIDNGHGFANQPMTVTIPIKISKDEFAMAFYYDKSNGELEGIPIVSLSENQIVITTSHFSDMVVSKTPKSEFDSIKIDTGFKPGVDDWQFKNNGSYIARGGHCAGQSITSMWYYYEKYKKAGERRLYGRFDNNDNGTGTIDFYLDDSWSYRYVSVVQKALAWDTTGSRLFEKLSGADDYLTYYAFAYSMLLTGNPQHTGLYTYDPQGNVASGHALVAYRIEKNTIYVADPNYPGDATRSIVYDTKTNKFIPYESGANAEEIKKGNSIAFTGIGYFAVSSMIDWSVVGNEYDKMVKGQSGNDVFPKFELYYVNSVNATGWESYEKCGSGITISEEETAKISPDLKGQLRFKIVGQYDNQRYYLYKGTNRIEFPINALGNRNYYPILVTLAKGVNDLGFYSTTVIDGKEKYIDFKRFKVTYGQTTTDNPVADKWVLDGEPVVVSEINAYNDKLVKAGIENGSATYDVVHMGMFENKGNIIGTTKAVFTMTEIPKELIVGSKVEFTVSGEYLGSGTCYDCQFGLYSPEIADVANGTYFTCGILLSDAARKKTMTSSATIPVKDEFNKGVLHIICVLDGPAGKQTVTYTYK
jgi:hypothetical protein